MVAFALVAVLAVLAWIYLLVGHGSFWRTDQRLPSTPDPDGWPAVVAIVPARDEAYILPLTLPPLLDQDYPGEFRVVLVDDESSDGTAHVALATDPHGVRLTVLRGAKPPPQWAGKVWAMTEGMTLAQNADFILFADADVSFEPGVVASLVRFAQAGRLDLVSQMARLGAVSFWEKALIPAFVYFFAQLYPFRRVNNERARTAAAAGGCMLVRRSALEAAGGLERIRGALIDDVSLAKLLKRKSGRIWLGHARGEVVAVRPHPRLADVWAMVARSADTQLRHSILLLAGTVAGMLVLYAGPPVTGIAGLTNPHGTAAAIAAGCGLGAWVIMAVTEAPILRMYGLSLLRALALPLVALLYTAMTVDSARRHRFGAGAEWKGRAETARRG